jgi:hypothetical protein
VDLARKSPIRYVDAAVAQDDEIPAAAEPTVNVGRLRNFRRAAVGDQHALKVGPVFGVRNHHDEILS